MMNAIQQFAKIGADRRSLRLEKPLPASFGTGRRHIAFSLVLPAEAETAATPAAGERQRKVWRGDAPWLRHPIEAGAPFTPLTREEAHERQPLH